MYMVGSRRVSLADSPNPIVVSAGASHGGEDVTTCWSASSDDDRRASNTRSEKLRKASMRSPHAEITSEGHEGHMRSRRCTLVCRSALGALAAGPVRVPVPATRQCRHMPIRKTRDAQTRASLTSPPAGQPPAKLPLEVVSPNGISSTTRISNASIRCYCVAPAARGLMYLRHEHSRNDHSLHSFITINDTTKESFRNDVLPLD